MLLVNAFAAGVGALAVFSAAYFVLDWNIPRTLVAVSARWGEIQRTFVMNRHTWLFIGLPIFLLFLAPGFWALAGLSLRPRPRRPPWRRPPWMNFGTRLAICTVAVMSFIYVIMGVTYELPRLWVAFLPTLLLGLAIDRPLLRASGPGQHPRVARALAIIVLVHVAFTAMHWTLLDAREAEFRLSTKRFYH
jgi:cytochrome b561